MKVKIDVEKTLSDMYPEDDLYDLSILEAVYQIRALKACLALKDIEIEVLEVTENGQAFINDFDIYVNVNVV